MDRPISKGFWKSKTLWFNVLTVVAFAVQYLVDNQMLAQYIQWELLGVALINLILRLMTDQRLTT